VLFARPEIVAPALATRIPVAEGAKPPPHFFPFLFITIACGAISGFHALVGSGTSAKQISRESDAQMVGYGSMLFEGFLAVLVIIAVSAGIGMRYKERFVFGAADAQALGIELEAMHLVTGQDAAREGADAVEPMSEEGLGRLQAVRRFHEYSPGASMEVIQRETGGVELAFTLAGEQAWNYHYRYHSWDEANGLASKLKAFVDGSANMMAAFGMPVVIGLAIMGVFVASFAGTTLDTATRLQRYIISELGRTVRLRPLENRYLATALAVGAAAGLALQDGRGAGAMILWPLFGALNQLLASLALLIIAVYLHRRGKPTWMVAIPFAFMLVVTAWAMTINIGTFLDEARWHLLIISAVVLALQVWVTVEAALVWLRIRRERGAAPPAGVT
jgi:carbon starvation protein